MAVLLIPVEVVLKLPAVMVRLLPPREILEALKPESVRVPLVAVRFKAPVVWVRPLEAVNVWVEVRDPALVVVIPVAPRVKDLVLAVPILTVPLVAPLPALTVTFPPVPPVPDSFPAFKFNAPPFWLLFALVAGCNDREFPPVKVVISGERFPARAN
jgi:hypothetical protein